MNGEFRAIWTIFNERFLSRFYPTRLALNIATGQNKPVARDMEKEGYIVVETNYRVYAYTNSNLQVALLGLFCEMLYRFPNLVVSILTRDSVRQALRSGITAAQIIGWVQINKNEIIRFIEDFVWKIQPKWLENTRTGVNVRNLKNTVYFFYFKLCIVEMQYKCIKFIFNESRQLGSAKDV